MWLQRRYVLYKNGTDLHYYCEAAAAVFIFGWMHTITYVKLFKDWHAFASIFKQIVAKDVTKFAYIFIFVLLRFVEAATLQKYNNNTMISKTVFMVLSSWHSHCESSPGSFDECRMAPSGCQPKTKPDDLGCPPVQAARVYTHHRHLLLLLSPKADTYFTVPQTVEGWVDLVGWLHTDMIYPSTDDHQSWY